MVGLIAASCTPWRRGGDADMEGDTGQLRSERGQGGFNAVDFIPDQPDESGSWPKGVVCSLRVVVGFDWVGRKLRNGRGLIPEH